MTAVFIFVRFRMQHVNENSLEKKVLTRYVRVMAGSWLSMKTKKSVITLQIKNSFSVKAYTGPYVSKES